MCCLCEVLNPLELEIQLVCELPCGDVGKQPVLLTEKPPLQTPSSESSIRNLSTSSENITNLFKTSHDLEKIKTIFGPSQQGKLTDN